VSGQAGGAAFAPPPEDCPVCPRLAAFRTENRRKYPEFHNAPVISFGPIDARLLVVGLAPGLKGANATGRPFTGDYAGDLLYATLGKFGFTRGTYAGRPDDGLELVDARITNAVRCVPPENKPVGKEIANCRPYLVAEIGAMSNLSVILALGTIAHNSVLTALGQRRAAHPFGHNVLYELEGGPALIASYHCSRYNTNTGRLTPEMFEAVFATIRGRLDVT
jgi:uracil-DNA glycosylase family 4